MGFRHCFILIFTLFLISSLSGQHEASNWYFGDGAGLSFVSGSAVSLNDGRLQTIEGSASISDRNGKLLFYTDGTTVYDRNHQIMQNGANLKGNVSSTQSAIIVPKPAHPGSYFIFTVDKPDYFRITNDPIEGVHFSEVDMSLNGGNGAVLPGAKNVHLVTYDSSNAEEREFKSSEKISSVIGGDCISYWVVTQFTNKFYAFKVTSAGVDTNPVISSLQNNFKPLINEQDLNVTAPGYMKISPDGTKLAAAYSGTALGSPRSGGAKNTGKVFLYDFDDLTGKVSNEKLLLANAYPYGVEFSPSSEKLYVTSNTYNNSDILQSGELYQFDLQAANIAGSIVEINSSRNVAGALQLAPNGKIYRAGYSTDGGYVKWDRISVINAPEESGNAVNYSHNSINIAPNSVKLGLPPFVQSLFNSHFEYENICQGQETLFTIPNSHYDSVIWDFGDGTTSTNLSPKHTFPSPGNYTVSLTGFINGIPQDPVCEEVNIFGRPAPTHDYILTQCDIQDNNGNDGLTEFNLELAGDYFREGNSGLQLYFYESRNAAENDVNNENSLNHIYRNSTPNQEIFVKILGFGSDCYIISSFRLHTTESVDLTVSPVYGCEMNNGIVEYNLESIEQTIIEDLNPADELSISFHESDQEALLGENPLSSPYYSIPKTIFIRAESKSICYGFGSVELKATSLPVNDQVLTLSACAMDFPLELGKDIELETPSNYYYYWSTGETTETINVNESGEYLLNLILKSSGCGREIKFEVEKHEAPQIVDIVIENYGKNNTLTVLTNPADGTPRFSIDDSEGPYQQSPVFNNVPGGLHTVYVRNELDCDIRNQQVILYGFPEYFTPNNDGYNDTWKPYELQEEDFKMERVTIYDRYGKIIAFLEPLSNGWNGTFNGKPMPADDYWFRILLKNGQEFSGHFSLVR